MFFLNLTAGEFFAVLTAAGGLITALYLLDRAKRRRIVSTLRFWSAAFSADEQSSRKRVREPWSLVLQLVSLLLLLLAIAQVQFGTRDGRGRDHVVIIDNSAWTADQTAAGRVLDREKEIANQYVSRLGSQDRVMIVHASGLATPLTPFTRDQAALRRAINDIQFEYSSLSLGQALSLAKQAQQWPGGRAGEVVYIGPRMTNEPAVAEFSGIAVRVIDVPVDLEDCGISHVAVRRASADAGFEATVTVRNYGPRDRAVSLETAFNKTQFLPRSLTVPARSEVSTRLAFLTDSAGQFAARISPHQGLELDDEARVSVPKPGVMTVEIYSARPDVLQPLFPRDGQFQAHFYTPAEYTGRSNPDVFVFDQFAPAQPPHGPSLYIDPPEPHSPVRIKQMVKDSSIRSWRSDDVISGLRSHEVRLGSTKVFQVFEGDIAIAGAPEGAVVVARPNNQDHAQLAAIGFDPFAKELRDQITTPLLFADLIDWLSPEAFRSYESSAVPAGVASIALEPGEGSQQVQVTADGRAVPFTLHRETLELFANRPQVVQVVTAGHRRSLSMTLPEITGSQWTPPADVLAGLPADRGLTHGVYELWRWLAVLGALGLFAEWQLFGARRLPPQRAQTMPIGPRSSKRGRELVAK